MIYNNGTVSTKPTNSTYINRLFSLRYFYNSVIIRIFFFVFYSILLCGCDKIGYEGGRGVSVEDDLEAATAEQLDFGRYHALIVGINDYDTWPQLKYAQGDAADVRQILIEDYGFLSENVNYLENKKATRKAILSTLTSTLKKLDEDDNLLIYVAAHGQLDSLTENGFWIPVEGDLYDESSWIRFSTVVEKINAINVKAKNILIVTDSCWGGALAGRSGPTPGLLTPDNDGSSAYLNSLNKIAGKSSRQVISSGGFEEVPDRSDFAELFKQQLRSNQLPKIDVEYMFFKNILPGLIELGVTRPSISKLQKGKNQQGQFIFVRADAQHNPDENDTGGRAITESGSNEISNLEENPGPDRSFDPDKITGTSSDSNSDFSNISQGGLVVRSNVSGDQIYINGEFVGASRLDLSLDEGPYSVRIIKAGYHSQEKNIFVKSNKSSQVDFKLQKISIAKPKVLGFNASQLSITQGQSVTLSWQTEDAVEATLNGKSVALSGATLEQPTYSQTYSLVAVNSEGIRVETALNINVEAAIANISLFDASNYQLIRGDTTTLTWKTDNAATVEIKGIGVVDASGSKRMSPSKSTNYSLIVTNKSGKQSSKTISVQVSEPTPDIVKFVAQPNAITSGQQTTLYWLYDNATTEQISASDSTKKITTIHGKKHNKFGKNISGRISVKPTKTTSYVLSVTNPDGESVKKMVSVKVVPKKISRPIGTHQINKNILNSNLKLVSPSTTNVNNLKAITPSIKSITTTQKLNIDKGEK